MQPIARTPSAALKCAACGWQNFSGSTSCFNCQQALPVAPAATAPAAGAPGAVPRASELVEGQPQVPTEGVTDMMSRVGATWIDAMLMCSGSALLVIYGLNRATGPNDSPGSWLLQIPLLMVLWLMLPAILDAWGGGSIGKRIAGLRMVTRSGQRPGLLRSLLRHTVKFGMNLVVPVIFHLFERKLLGGRHLHEAVSGSRVVWRDPTARPAVMWWVIGITFLPLALFSIGMQSLGERSGASQTSAIRRAWAMSLPVKTAVSAHLKAEGKFPPGAALPAMAGQHVESIDQDSGRIVIKLDEGPAVGVLLVLWPEVWNKDPTHIVRWRCATERMDDELAPAICKDVQPT